MAGERLLELINARGGNNSEYADLVFGTVTSTSPLKIQYTEKIFLTDVFLILGKHVQDHEETMLINGTEKKVTIKQALKTDDKVAMFRLDGGQRFYVFEKM
ncbi:DUF2577 domain-containing protein (plasmid) [Apilactobacillus apisilvae]|uniref:DUF2577 domain-containing protein n=1 Tax=Apilactobacillus apisilvae TaxID=2923364 RepID=A0ABY4PJR4_9LACO|nr:DUF2577 domain-containing protein [Apilactobacillus apisilvae]UQS85870.1 DUF2577 domain-containing protein [Apilactobacillus apisilvae]